MIDKNSSKEFNHIFRKAVGEVPFRYQVKIAEDGNYDLINIPTGMGKTAGSILSWVWRRKLAGEEIREETPRRLVYCLPMRTLVEQTYEEVKTWLSKLVEENVIDGDIGVYKVMGGDQNDGWEIYPEKDSILIGTQDMLLSRSLNKGYGLSKFHWPVPFGLLNNDALWIMDEVQLMGEGLPTTAQLDAFRREYGTFCDTDTVWMSATCEKDWLETVDHSEIKDENVLILSDRDLEHDIISKRYHAVKTLLDCDMSLESTSKRKTRKYCENVADIVADKVKESDKEVVECEEEDSIRKKVSEQPFYLIVMNSVDRAKKAYEYIDDKLDSEEDPEVILIHSRFREEERERLNELVSQNPEDDEFSENGRVVVGTQVVEAGLDISSNFMVTELAPWTSLVQRFGRLNRYGEFNEGEAIVLDIKTEGRTADSLALPYTPEKLDKSKEILKDLEGVSIKEIDNSDITIDYETSNVLRKKDLEEIFDNTEDISGYDIDISRFIRDTEDKDVQVYWRDWDKDESYKPPEDMSEIQREELCSVPVHSFEDFIEDEEAWKWDYLRGGWTKAQSNDVVPGERYLIHSDDGGYTEEKGWQIDSDNYVKPTYKEEGVMEHTSSDQYVNKGEWETLEEHTSKALDILESIVDALANDDLTDSDYEYHNALFEAAKYHDLGKAHDVFQKAIVSDTDKDLDGGKWAKSSGTSNINYERKYFRHELASALILLNNTDIISKDNKMYQDLVMYLVCSHHGKIRQSMRSLPDEMVPPDGSRFARGIWEGDIIREFEFFDELIPETEIDLSVMDVGMNENGSRPWLDRVTSLRDSKELGIFRLSFLEALLRVADWRASMDGGDADE